MADKKPIEVLGQFTAVAAVFAFGIVVGGRMCSEPPKEVIVEKETIVEKIVETCPPNTVEQTADVQKSKKRVKSLPTKVVKRKTVAPPEENQDSGLNRRRLLTWARDQSSTLKPCRQSPLPVSLTVKLSLSKAGAIRTVSLNAPRSELGMSTKSCLRDRIRRWEPPTELVVGQDTLVFGLTL